MSLYKSAEFIADVERQAKWYVDQEGWELGNRYLDAVEATCQLLNRHPQLGPSARFHHPRLKAWRFFLVFRPFKRHILFYEISGQDVNMRRALHGFRHLPRRLLEPPESS